MAMPCQQEPSLGYNAAMDAPPKTFAEFWPRYVVAHSRSATRAMHLAGTLAGWGLLLGAVILAKPVLVLAALVVPYALAWFSHFFIENNTPASFKNPLWSWMADQKMTAMILAGKMAAEVRRCAEQH
jgi:hypothetical protein